MLQRASRSEPVRGGVTGAELNLATRPCMMRRMMGCLALTFPLPKREPAQRKKKQHDAAS